MIHWLKTVDAIFDIVWDFDKAFEIRQDDRNYQLDDILILARGTEDSKAAKAVIAQVTSIITSGCCDGLAAGYVGLGIKILGRLSDLDELSLFTYHRQSLTSEEWSSKRKVEASL